MNKKFLVLSIISFFVVIAGFFLFSKNNKTIYIKNSAPHLAIASITQKVYQAEDKIGDLSNNIIPKIVTPENLTENFAELLAKEIIGKNNQPKDGNSPAGPGLNMPDPNKIAEEFIKNGLAKANENILNIKLPNIKTSPDNSREAVVTYLAEIQKIIKDNLKGEPILSVLEEINKNNGQGLEKLLPIISAHEAAANQIEEKLAPASLKRLITEEVELLRVTANILRALINVESDPMGGIAATKQFESVLKNWSELQKKFDIFIQKLNGIK